MSCFFQVKHTTPHKVATSSLLTENWLDDAEGYDTEYPSWEAEYDAGGRVVGGEYIWRTTADWKELFFNLEHLYEVALYELETTPSDNEYWGLEQARCEWHEGDTGRGLLYYDGAGSPR